MQEELPEEDFNEWIDDYWCNKARHKIDFIFLKNRHSEPATIECKWSANNFNAKNLMKFRKLYPKGNNYVVASDVDRPFAKTIDDITITFVGISDLVDILSDS